MIAGDLFFLHLQFHFHKLGCNQQMVLSLKQKLAGNYVYVWSGDKDRMLREIILQIKKNYFGIIKASRKWL